MLSATVMCIDSLLVLVLFWTTGKSDNVDVDGVTVTVGLTLSSLRS